MLVGEGPGVWEDKSGRPFDGRAGQELDRTYLPLAGLSRNEVYVTNVVQCRQERNGVDVKPGKELMKSCADNHLWDEIAAVNPEILILCGATACETVDPNIDLELQHGFPYWSEKAPYCWIVPWIVPMYHPAAGMHESRFMIPLLEDWERLGKWMRGEWSPPRPDDATVDYQLLETINEFTAYVDDIFAILSNAIDTENDEDRPYSLQFSHSPRTGRMILASNKRLIAAFTDWNYECSSDWYAHHEAHDLNVLEKMGVDLLHRHPRFGPVTVYDTMQELFHLGNLPQGLKAAVYRTLGHRMTSYDEVVTPYSKRELESWLATALDHFSTHREIEPHPPGKGCPTCGKNHRKDVSKPINHPAEATVRRVMGKLTDGSDYDPWQMPKYERDGTYKPRLIGRNWLEPVESSIGRMPRRSIVHAPMEQQILYSCSDADWTGRLATWLERERERIVREEWKVA